MGTTMITGTPTTTMDDPGRLIRLFSWLSPAFPIGGFAYSQGLETAIADKTVRDADALCQWIEGQMHLGGLRNDAFFLAIAARAIGTSDRDAFLEASAYCLALQISSERDKETREQARSFIDAAGAWQEQTPDWLQIALAGPIALPIAFGALAALHRIDRPSAVAGFVNAAIAQQISVGIRLIPLGQSAGLAIQAALETRVAALARAALAAGIKDVASLSYGADIASLRHEDLGTRIFRS